MKTILTSRQIKRITRQCAEISEMATGAETATEIGVARMGAEWLARDFRLLELRAIEKAKGKNQ